MAVATDVTVSGLCVHGGGLLQSASLATFPTFSKSVRGRHWNVHFGKMTFHGLEMQLPGGFPGARGK